ERGGASRMIPNLEFNDPTHQKLTEEHALALSVETLRGWMIAAGIWVPRTQRARRSCPPRVRRACLGELIQIDGSDHACFEERGPRCTLLVYDAHAQRLVATELRAAALGIPCALPAQSGDDDTDHRRT